MTAPCPHQLSGLLCRLRERMVQDRAGTQHKVALPCKIVLGEKCPFGFGKGEKCQTKT